MKTRLAILLSVMAAVVLLFSAEPNWAAKSKSSSEGIRVGIIKIRTIFEQCKRNEKYKEMMAAEQEKVMAELEKLKAELDAEKAGLRTLKPDSTEYLDQMKQYLSKQANYTAQQEFHKQQMAVKERQWIEELYKDIMRITADVAEDKGLDLVLEASEPDLTDNTTEALIMNIRTHKVLYSDGCEDITKEVLSKLDAGK